ncbi:MAG: hypothetical protein PX635_17925 [Nostocales cyanobacterium LE14-WE12]|jgi:hypothetical protein|nr:hypothetical protein [Nostocales cyanobacterium LE14-WE12]
MIKVRLSYTRRLYLFDAGVIDLNTKCQVSLDDIEDYDNFGWLELTADKLENVCEYCSNLGIESNVTLSDFPYWELSYWYSYDQNYRLDIKSDSGEDLGLVNKIFEINLGLWKSKLIRENKNLKRINSSLNI